MEEKKPTVKNKIHPLLITNFNAVMFQITIDVAVLYWLWKYHKDFITEHAWINGFIFGYIIVEWAMGVILCLGYLVAIACKQVWILEPPKKQQENNKSNNEKK